MSRPIETRSAADARAPLTIELVPESRRRELWHCLQAHLREHAAFTGKKPVDGVFPYPWFELYWQAGERRWPYWALIDGEVAGFALVCVDDADGRHQIAEFFVIKSFRRRGLGREFAHRLLHCNLGLWKVRQAIANVAAAAFWGNVLAGFADRVEVPLTRADGVDVLEHRFTMSRGDRSAIG